MSSIKLLISLSMIWNASSCFADPSPQGSAVAIAIATAGGTLEAISISVGSGGLFDSAVKGYAADGNYAIGTFVNIVEDAGPGPDVTCSVFESSVLTSETPCVDER